MHPALRRTFVLALAASASLLVGRAQAASFSKDARLDDDFERTISAGDVQVYRLSVVAGTAFSLRVKESDTDVTLTLRSPGGNVVGTDSGEKPRIDAFAAESGTYRVEVSDAAGSGEYRIELGGDAPPTGGGGGTTPPGGGTIHVDVPRAALVRLEARRLSGAAPEITAVTDGAGRPLSFHVVRSQRDKVRLAALPVSAPGGLDVTVRGADGQTGTYEIRYRVLDEDDDGPGGDDHGREERRLVLTLAPGADPVAVAAALGYELESVGDGFIVVETPEGREGFEHEDSADADDRLEDVTGAEPDSYLLAPEGTQSNPMVLGSDLGRSNVIDQAAMTTIRASVAQRKATGAGVIVAVLDTGVYAAHEALAGHVLPGIDMIDADADPSEVANGLDDDLDGEVDEGFGHGTFIAGLILAVAPDAQILPVRVLDSDARGTVSSIAAGIEWAVKNGADVINLSLGVDARSGVLTDAVNHAIGNDVVVVAATGNGARTNGVSQPAGISGVIAVTATDVAGAPAGFANGGPGTTLSAPGTALVGPVPPNTQNALYATWSGTSFSAALATGGAALVRERLPTAQLGQIMTRFRTSARTAPAALPRAKRRLLGAGRLDLAKLVR